MKELMCISLDLRSLPPALILRRNHAVYGRNVHRFSLLTTFTAQVPGGRPVLGGKIHPQGSSECALEIS